MATVTKLHGKWYLDYRDARGKRHREVAGDGKTKKYAEKLLRQRLDLVDRGGAGGARVTFADYASLWLKRKKLSVKPGTFVEYRAKLRYLLNSEYGLGDVRLERINKPAVEDFRLAMVTAEDLSPKSVNNAVVLLGGILQGAVEDGLIDYNPARLVKKLPAPARDVDFLTPKELQELFAGARLVPRVGHPLELMIRLSAFTGIRRGEMLALRWQDLDLKQQRLFVRRSYRSGIFGEPKSRRSKRPLNIPPGVCQRLREFKMETGNPQGPALIFHSGAGEPWQPSLISCRFWNRALRAAGLRESIRWHDLRHTYATLMMNAGESVKYIQEQLGHASGQMTIDTYSHLMPDAGRDATDRLEQIVELRKFDTRMD